jgi:hypothetical protein
MASHLRFKGPRSDDPEVQVTLVVDRSFFHDLFRTSYGPLRNADWLLAYLTVRQSLDMGPPVVVTSSSIIREVRSEFRTLKSAESGGQRLPVLVAAVQNVIFEIPLPETVVPKHAVLYVAKIEADLAHLPVIVSSVDTETLKERAHAAGLDMKLEGFTPTMSVRRLDDRCWFVHVRPGGLPEVLLETDPLFQEVAKQVGFPIPPDVAEPANSPTTPAPKVTHHK